MATTKLTQAFVDAAKAEPGKERTIYWDESKRSVQGFGLMVTSQGHRSFVIQYRIHGRSRRYTLKGLPTLEAAREQAKVIQGSISAGQDPLEDERRRAEAGKNTLKAIAENYLHREGGKIRTGEIRRRMLARLVFPKLGDRPITDIKRREIVELLDGIEDKSGAATADQVFAFLRRIFNWHEGRDDDFVTPIRRGMRESKKNERSRALSDEELRQVWKTAETYPGPWGQFVRILLLTAARRNEVAGMAWGEIRDGLWVIPAVRCKTKKDVTLPLSGAARKVLDEIPRIQGCDHPFSTDGRHPISGFSTFKLVFDQKCGVPGPNAPKEKRWTLHDLRRTARSLLGRAGVRPDIAERCIGHTVPGMERIYDRFQYTEEMRLAFEKLASLIERIVRQEPNVIAMERKISGALGQ